MVTTTDPDESLKRLGGGRWQTRDERFTIEPQSGTWVVVDADQTDDLGLALVRGPFGSLGAAKTAIAQARGSQPATSPLASRMAKASEQPATGTAAPGRSDPDRTQATTAKRNRAKTASSTGKAGKSTTTAPPPTAPEPPPEPRWMRDLEPAERRRAKRLIEALTKDGARDPEGLVRRDLVGDVPTIATFALTRALRALGADASPAAVARLLTGERDEGLGVRWRLVDGEDRPITIEVDDLEA